MALFKLFKAPKHQRYRYIPRHWDPEKEELEKRLKEVEGRKENSPEQMKARISSKLKRRGGRYEESKELKRKALRSYNIRMILMLVFILWLSYVVIVKYLPRIVAFVEGAQ